MKKRKQFKLINNLKTAKVFMAVLLLIANASFAQSKTITGQVTMEGRRLFDIRRWRIADKVMNGPRYGNNKRTFLVSPPTFDENTSPDYSNIPNRSILRVIETMVFNPDKHYLWPIHPVELQTNTALTQNPNW